MKKKEDGYMLLNDAVNYVMKTTGRTRKQAEQCVLQALKSGKVKARAEVIVTDETGEQESLGVQPVDAEVFRSIPSEH